MKSAETVTFVVLLVTGKGSGPEVPVTTGAALPVQFKPHSESEPLQSSSIPFSQISCEGAPGVQVSSSIRRERGRVLGHSVDVSGVDPKTIDQVFHLEWSEGSPLVLQSLGPKDAIVRKSFADEFGFARGGQFLVRTPTGLMMNLRVAAIYDPPRFDSMLGSVVVPQSTFDRFFDRPSDAQLRFAGEWRV